MAALVLLAGIVLPVPAAAATLAADTSDFSFDSFDASYELGVHDGRASVRVVETLVARFPDFDQNRGIIRAIPLRDGEVDLQLKVLSVTDENGDPVHWERGDHGGFAELALGTDEFVHGRQTYVIEYTMRDVIRHFPDAGVDEFYWDINGNGWAQRFERVSARITLDDELSAALSGSAACYAGRYGETTSCEIVQESSGAFSVSVGPLPGYSTVTVAIGFDGGTVVQPELPRDSWMVQLAPKLLAGLALLQLAIAIVVRTIAWRDRRGRGIVIPQFEPPADSNLLLDANIVGRSSLGLPALLIDFAVRGFIRIIDKQPDSITTGDKHRYELELGSVEVELEPQERRVLEMLFGSLGRVGKRINPGWLSSDTGASLHGLSSSTARTAVTKGLRYQAGSARTQKWLRRALLVTVLLFVPVWVWALWHEVTGAGAVGWLFALTVVVAITASAFLSRPTRLTARGARAKEHLLGIREYLTIAEAERIRVLQSPRGAERVDVTDRDAVVRLDERLLGYAVLWGVEDEWAAHLQAHYPEASPEWLEGGRLDASFVHDFASASVSSVRPIRTVSSRSGSSWSSSGSSSFSSGSSGGGFSGGGGGGGGGGGR